MYEVRMQMPFECVDESMPEPDGGVFTAEHDARRPHPNAALWLIEVADSSVELDREKALDDAAARVPEYWVIHVVDRLIEIFRDPTADASAALGYRYSWHHVYRESEQVAPLIAPQQTVLVSTLLSAQ
jgi:Uma2 family endonuclease